VEHLPPQRRTGLVEVVRAVPPSEHGAGGADVDPGGGHDGGAGAAVGVALTISLAFGGEPGEEDLGRPVAPFHHGLAQGPGRVAPVVEGGAGQLVEREPAVVAGRAAG
jgi:hypothetical protein